MKRYNLQCFITIWLLCFSAYSQKVDWCITNEEADYSINDKKQELESFTKIFAQSYKKTSTEKYIIPIVFHVLHDDGPENISDDQIIDAVGILNKDYNRANADTLEIVADFKSISANCSIDFVLAKKDPDGNTTNGVDRIKTLLTNNANKDSKINQWPREKYLNVWVVNNLKSGAVGNSYYPPAVDIKPELDGILIKYDFVGSIGEGSVEKSRSLTHEIGHYLNLYHTWGSSAIGTICGDDEVADTPVTKGSSSCNLNTNTCTGVIENVQNFMDYSKCPHMFTEGQKQRIHATLNSSISQRNNLWTQANLIETGITEINSINKENSLIRGVTLFPNPISSSSSLSFDIPEQQQVKIVLFDCYGKIVKEFGDATLSQGHHELKLAFEEEIPKGLYFLCFINSKGRKSIVLIK